MEKQTFGLIKLIVSMLIFGSIGLFVRYIPLNSSVIALIRAVVGVVFLVGIMLVKRTRLSVDTIRNNLLLLILSGTAIGFNWILLFESYRYTSVAVSTLCYYMAPMIVMALSPLVLKERITGKRLLCICIALAGIALISGIFRIGSLEHRELTGIFFGLGAAALYATVILINKQFRGISSMERTVCQLSIAAAVLLPYTILTADFSFKAVTPVCWILLAVLGIVHTGFAYYLYFGSMEHLRGQSIATASYIDPVFAVILSAVVLREPFTTETVIGAVAILGAAFVCEMPYERGQKNDN